MSLQAIEVIRGADRDCQPGDCTFLARCGCALVISTTDVHFVVLYMSSSGFKVTLLRTS